MPHDKFEVFFLNSLHKMKTLLPDGQWGYVPSSSNTFLSRAALDHAALCCKMFTTRYFEKLFLDLSHNRPIGVKSVARLRPFKDTWGLICVGGRLSSAEVPEAQKHPI